MTHHHEEKHQHHQKEREHEKKLEKEREEKVMQQSSAIHPAWFVVVGVVLMAGVLVVWLILWL